MKLASGLYLAWGRAKNEDGKYFFIHIVWDRKWMLIDGSYDISTPISTNAKWKEQFAHTRLSTQLMEY